MVDANLKSAFFCCQAVLPYMKEHGGTIVNMSSIGARRTMYPTGSLSSDLPYHAAKGGIIGLTKSLASELGPFGIRINALAPGLNLGGSTTGKRWTQQYADEQRQQYMNAIPLRRWGSADDIIGVMMFLVTEESAYITGQILDVNGGSYSS